MHPDVSNSLPPVPIDAASRKRRRTHSTVPLIEHGSKTGDLRFELLNPPESTKDEK